MKIISLNNIKNRFDSDFLNLIKHSKNYFTGEAASKIFLLLTLPIITRILTTEEYGIYQLFITLVSLSAVVLTLNFHGSIARYYFDEPNDPVQFITFSLSGSYLLLIISYVIISSFSISIANFLNIPPNILHLIYLNIFFLIAIQAYNHKCIANQQSASFALIKTFIVVVGIMSGIIIAVTIHNNKYLGFIYGALISHFIIFAYLIFKYGNNYAWEPHWHHFKFILNYSLPLALYMLSNVILGQFDRIMINKYLGSSDTGLYSLAYNIGMITSMITALTQRALIPNWFRLMRKKYYHRVDLITDKAFKITICVALILSIFSKEIISLLATAEFIISYKIIPIIVLGYVFEALFKIFGRVIGYTNKMFYITLIGLISGGANIILNILFLPRFGYIAAAYTTLISYFIMFLLSYFISKFILKERTTPLNYFVKPIILFSLTIIIYKFISILNLYYYHQLIINIILCLLTIYLIIFSKFHILTFNR